MMAAEQLLSSAEMEAWVIEAIDVVDKKDTAAAGGEVNVMEPRPADHVSASSFWVSQPPEELGECLRSYEPTNAMAARAKTKRPACTSVHMT